MTNNATEIYPGPIATPEPRDLRTAVKMEDGILGELRTMLTEIHMILTGSSAPDRKSDIVNNFTEAVWANVEHTKFCRSLAAEILRELRG